LISLYQALCVVDIHADKTGFYKITTVGEMKCYKSKVIKNTRENISLLNSKNIFYEIESEQIYVYIPVTFKDYKKIKYILMMLVYIMIGLVLV